MAAVHIGLFLTGGIHGIGVADASILFLQRLNSREHGV